MGRRRRSSTFSSEEGRRRKKKKKEKNHASKRREQPSIKPRLTEKEEEEEYLYLNLDAVRSLTNDLFKISVHAALVQVPGLLALLDDGAEVTLEAIGIQSSTTPSVETCRRDTRRLHKKVRHLLRALDVQEKNRNGIPIDSNNESDPTAYGKRPHRKASVKKIYVRIMNGVKNEVQLDGSELLTPSHPNFDSQPASTNRIEAKVEVEPMKASLPVVAQDESKQKQQLSHKSSSRVRKGPAPPAPNDYLEQAMADTEDLAEDPPSLKDESGGREAWMTEAPEELAGLFSQKMKGRDKGKPDPIEVAMIAQQNALMKAEMDAYNAEFRSQSLLEMYQSGCFGKSVPQQKELLKKMKENDPWGKRPVEQSVAARIASQKSSQSGPSDGDPWNHFDRERDMATNSQLNKADLSRLHNQTKEFSAKFTSSTVQSSFL